jgi:hypothetical protein
VRWFQRIQAHLLYLDNTEAVEDYMRQQEDSATEMRAFLDSHLDSAALRTRIRARH